MVKKSETIYIDLGFEHLMSFIYGSGGHSCHAGHTPIRYLKKQLLQIFRTLKTVIRKNVTGDDRHKEYMIERCDSAIGAIQHAKSKDELIGDTLSAAFQLIFELIGHFPHNWASRKAHHSRITDLSAYRTFNYARTARQKAKQITDYAYTKKEGECHPDFEVLISKLKKDFSDDPHKFLDWLRAEHRQLYDQFI
jgi:hypothetical protein